MFTCSHCGSRNIMVNTFFVDNFTTVEYSCLCQNPDCKEYFYGKEHYRKVVDTINVLINRNNTLREVKYLLEREENDQAELVDFVNNNDYGEQVY